MTDVGIRDGHIIDLAVTCQDDNMVHMTSVHSMISDHTAMHIHLNMSKPPRPTRTISFRKIRAIDQNCLADDIRESAIPWCVSTIQLRGVSWKNMPHSKARHSLFGKWSLGSQMKLRTQSNSIGNFGKTLETDSFNCTSPDVPSTETTPQWFDELWKG